MNSYSRLLGAALGNRKGVTHMQWTTPQFEEICLNCEINSYAQAKL
jgi:coenzyme PQQ precursor peptide PqqA